MFFSNLKHSWDIVVRLRNCYSQTGPNGLNAGKLKLTTSAGSLTFGINSGHMFGHHRRDSEDNALLVVSRTGTWPNAASWDDALGQTAIH